MNNPREITTHKLNGLNDALKITAIDERAESGSHHEYEIQWPDATIDPPGGAHGGGNTATIRFQKGALLETGVNGISNEALLAILIDRLRGFQGMDPVHAPLPARLTPDALKPTDPAPFRCRENACALTHLEEAMFWLQKRTRDRLARGVEGTLIA